MPASTGPLAGKSDLTVATVVGAAGEEVVVGVSWPVCVVHAARARAMATSPILGSLCSFMTEKALPVAFVRQRIPSCTTDSEILLSYDVGPLGSIQC